MRRESKKAKERAILRKVYSELDFPRAEDRDPPDFLLWPKTGAAPFGVEVTRLFPSEPMARLKEIPGYSAEIFLRQRYRHKDDVSALRISDLTFHPNDDSKRLTVKVIGQELPQRAEHLRLLANMITSKSDKVRSYESEVSHANLIILDTIEPLWREEPESACTYYMTSELRRTVLRTGFREIYLITKVGDRREMFFPLRFTALISELAIFSKAVEERPATASLTQEELIPLFVALWRREGLDVQVLKREGAPAHVLFANCSAGADAIRWYDDEPLPADAQAASGASLEILGDGFAELYEEFAADRVAVANLGRDVNGVRPAPE